MLLLLLEPTSYTSCRHAIVSARDRRPFTQSEEICDASSVVGSGLLASGFAITAGALHAGFGPGIILYAFASALAVAAVLQVLGMMLATKMNHRRGAQAEAASPAAVIQSSE
jgi:hypothetical protein